MNNIKVVYEDLRDNIYLKGYVFLNNGKKVGEFIYYLDEDSLEIYDLIEECTDFYINTSIYEIYEVLEQHFYWGWE